MFCVMFCVYHSIIISYYYHIYLLLHIVQPTACRCIVVRLRYAGIKMRRSTMHRYFSTGPTGLSSQNGHGTTQLFLCISSYLDEQSTQTVRLHCNQTLRKNTGQHRRDSKG